MRRYECAAGMQTEAGKKEPPTPTNTPQAQMRDDGLPLNPYETVPLLRKHAQNLVSFWTRWNFERFGRT